MAEKILVVYYSHSGNTQKIATLIHHILGAELHEIQPVKPYPEAYKAVVDLAKKEIQAGYLPPLQSKMDSLDEFDPIFVGSPNWWSTIAPPIATFLKEPDTSGKTIVPFCTHGGGGLGRIGEDIAKLCPTATVCPCFGIYGSGGGNVETNISEWLHNLGFMQ